MNCTVKKHELVRAMKMAQAIADRRSTMPILANVLLRADAKGKLTVAATDLNVTVTVELAAKVTEPGGLTVGAKTLFDVIDPPYTEQYARDLYGVEYPRPSHLLAEAARVAKPCAVIGFVHYIVPMPPDGCTFVKTLGLSMGFGFPMRAVTLFRREQERLL